MSAKGDLRKILQIALFACAVVLCGATAGPALGASGPATEFRGLPEAEAGSGTRLAKAPDPARAGVSIVRGRAARISDWPWQVALTLRRRVVPKKVRPTARLLCGGALIAPRLVVTAGHCVSLLGRPKSSRIEVVSGRTWLNHATAGRTTAVKSVLMPRNPKTGRLLYREREGSASWDVALLLLKKPLSTPTIKLPGADEIAATKPGHTVRATGWGVTRPLRRTASPGLRMAGQVIFPGRVCRGSEGSLFSTRLMTCSGGPAGNASTCSGDSGGPLAARVGREYRLVGLTSWGDGLCRGSRPSVYTRLSSGPIRHWVASTALRLTGEKVTGGGGAVAVAPKWCRVPRLWGFTVGRARVRLERNGCALGAVRRDRFAYGPRNRISVVSRIPGWLAPVGFRLRVWLPG